MADSEKIRLLLDQGLTAYGLGNVDEALQAWRSVLEMDPNNQKAKEYIRFVEENWGPRQERYEEFPAEGKPYRPDEGSGEIEKPPELSAPPAPAPHAVPKTEPAEPPKPERPATEPSSEVHAGFEESAFTPPAKPIVQQDQWGDLYDFGKREEVDEPVPPLPTLEPAPAPEIPPQLPATPDQEQIAPLAGDWSTVLTPEEQTPPSTLPPHPEELEEIEIVEEVEPQPSDTPPAPDEAAKRDQIAPTKRYESVPTLVRPAEQPLVSKAVPPAVEPESLARDSFDRFPVEAEPSGMPESLDAENGPSGPGFFQTPRPETTPPLGSPILQTDGGDLLDLVAGEDASAVEMAAVPGIAAVSEIESLMKGARDMLELDDFSGAIELLDKVLEQDPGHSRAKSMRGEAEGELLSMLSSKLGNLNRVPRVRMSQDEIIWLNLDNRAGFILSLVDGSLSLDEVISICGLPQLEGMRILVQLLNERVIEFS